MSGISRLSDGLRWRQDTIMLSRWISGIRDFKSDLTVSSVSMSSESRDTSSFSVIEPTSKPHCSSPSI